MLCKICSQPSRSFTQARIRGQYDIQLYVCSSCGFVQTERPYWLAEAYSSPINESDIGLVSRNLEAVKLTSALIASFFKKDGPFVDFAGGYGLFVRMMRDRGFDFYWQDLHSPNLFAQGFECGKSLEGRAELVTAFEVFEHFADPLEEIQPVLKLSRNIWLSTRLISNPPPQPSAWDYYGLDHGQHISFFTRQALEEMARRLGLNLYTNGATLHLMTEKKVGTRWFRCILHHSVAALVNCLCKQPSLLDHDAAAMAGQKVKSNDNG